MAKIALVNTGKFGQWFFQAQVSIELLLRGKKIRLQKLLLFILISVYCFSAVAQQQKNNSSKKLFPITLTFQNRVDSQILSLDSTYTNPQGEAFTVRNFRYYISHLSITNEKGKTWSLPQRYFLIDERKPESKSISVQVPFSQIKTVRFSIGVDSTQNVSGVQTGALDPANGMFWTWNSGYIFAKLEGTSPLSKAPQNGFTYHIGGFRKGENAIRWITLPVNKTLSIHKTSTITLSANVNTWFGNTKIAELPSIMQPGAPAMQMADRYSKMFSIVE